MGFFSNRRNRIIEDHLHQMIRTGVQEADFPNLYFEAACRYAQENGGKLYPDIRDSIIFDKTVAGQDYSVFFFVGRGGRGTNVTLTRKTTSSEIGAQPTKEIGAIRDSALESFRDRRAVKLRPAAEDDIRGFFETYATNIPSKAAINEAGMVQLGIVDVPQIGILVVFVVLSGNEALINVPGDMPRDRLSKRNELINWQNESFSEFWSKIQAHLLNQN